MFSDLSVAVVWRPMTTLRERFIRELVIRGTALGTQKRYVAAAYDLARHYHLAPDQITDEQLKYYVFYLAQERKLSPASLNVSIYSLRSIYTVVVQQEP